MNTPGYAKFVAQRRPTNPLFLKVWERLQADGALEGLEGDAKLEKLISTTEHLIESANDLRRH